MAELWKDIATRKQKERADRIPHAWRLPPSAANDRDNVLDVPGQCGILSADELRITEQYDATALIQALASRSLTSVAVVKAFCKRAALAQQLTNCLTEIFFDDALARAEYLDAHLWKHGKPMGPLHGLPMSLKDTFKVKGYDASVGLASLCFKPATSNSTLVDLLLEQGAILYCKTNVPQTMMALDSHNNVFGRTTNPLNRDLTAGGSSGGEGALIAMKGSPIGIGTDVGGSIRIPALCNGLVGFKPSHGRVPFAGQEGGNAPGSSKLAIEATAGPIVRNVRDAELLLKVIGQSSPHLLDPDVIPQSWHQQNSIRTITASNKALKIGIARTDGHSTPLPPIQRLVDEVSHRLRSSSLLLSEAIEVFDVDISSFGKDILKTFNGLMSIDGSNNWFDLLEPTGEPLSPWLSSRIRRRPKKALDEIKKLQGQKLDFQTRLVDIWKESGGYWSTPDSKARKGDRVIDVIISPAAPHPVAPTDRWNTANYTAMFNLLDYPAGVIPVRTFQEADMQGEVPSSPPMNGWDKINRELWTNVDRKLYLGSPLSIQVVAPKLMDRKLVEVMAVLEKALAPLRSSPASSSKL